MFDHVSKSSHGEEATSRTSSQARQPSWMSHWTKENSKAELKKSSLIRNGDGCADDKSGTAVSRLKMEGGFSMLGKGVSKDPDAMLAGVVDNREKPGILKNGISDPLFPTVSCCENNGTSSTIRTQGSHEFGNKSVSLALAPGREDISTSLNLLHENNWRSNGKQPVYDSLGGQKGLAFPISCAGKKAASALGHGSNHADASGPVVVFGKHYSNGNFRQNGQSPNKNFQTLFYKQQCKSGQNHSTARVFPSDLSNIHQGNLHQGSNSPESIPCFRNFETMRICNMVDSVQNSPEGHHKVSQRAHQFLFTKGTSLNLSNGHHELSELTSFTQSEEKTFGPFHVSPEFAYSKPSGVKIQPLWTSTDSDEKENTGNSSTSKAGSRNEESSGMLVEPPKKRHSLSGMVSSPLHKDDIVDENSTSVACDSSTEKTRNKRPLLEIPDITEELPGIQPAASSTGGNEASTSRVLRLNAKQIFLDRKQTSRNEYNGGQDRPLGPDMSNRWIKRLKLNCSDSFGVGTKSSDGNGSSYDKISSSFNRHVKGNKDNFEAKLSKQHSEGQMTVDQNVESMLSRKRDQSVMRGCSWIQRWCQNSAAPLTRNPEPLVICEPHSFNFGEEETPKKHFPSIGALALMGKAINGVRSCEFRTRGSVVVWNTKEN